MCLQVWVRTKIERWTLPHPNSFWAQIWFALRSLPLQYCPWYYELPFWTSEKWYTQCKFAQFFDHSIFPAVTLLQFSSLGIIIKLLSFSYHHDKAIKEVLCSVGKVPARLHAHLYCRKSHSKFSLLHPENQSCLICHGNLSLEI